MIPTGLVLGIVFGLTATVITCYLLLRWMASRAQRQKVLLGKAYAVVVMEERRFSPPIHRLCVIKRKPSPIELSELQKYYLSSECGQNDK